MSKILAMSLAGYCLAELPQADQWADDMCQAAASVIYETAESSQEIEAYNKISEFVRTLTDDADVIDHLTDLLCDYTSAHEQHVGTICYYSGFERAQR